VTLTDRKDKENIDITLPLGWHYSKLKDVVNEAQAGFACGTRSPVGIIQLRMNNVDTLGNFVWDEYLRVPAEVTNLEKYRLETGDILFNNTNSTELVGKSALFQSYPESVVYSNHFTRIRVNSEYVFPTYVVAWLNWQYNRGTFANLCNRWIGQSAVKNEILFDLNIPLPPTLAEQKRISYILNEKMATIEKARAAAEARLEAVKALSDSYLRLTFDNKKIQSCPRKRLGDVCEITAKQVDPKKPEYASLPHVNGENIESGTCRITYLKTAGELGMTSGKYIFNAGNVLYSKLRPYLRKVAVVDFKGVCSADMYPISTSKGIIEPDFLAWILVSDEFTNYADGESRRARMPKLNREQLLSWKIPIPSLLSQHETVSKLSQQLTRTRKLSDFIRQELETINALPAALLKRAFTGGL
jgi:type I restriction enzyme, S subunit